MVSKIFNTKVLTNYDVQNTKVGSTPICGPIANELFCLIFPTLKLLRLVYIISHKSWPVNTLGLRKSTGFYFLVASVGLRNSKGDDDDGADAADND